MWTAQQLSEFIERRLGQMMHRPIMFGGTGQGVDSLRPQLAERHSVDKGIFDACQGKLLWFTHIQPNKRLLGF